MFAAYSPFLLNKICLKLKKSKTFDVGISFIIHHSLLKAFNCLSIPFFPELVYVFQQLQSWSCMLHQISVASFFSTEQSLLLFKWKQKIHFALPVELSKRSKLICLCSEGLRRHTRNSQLWRLLSSRELSKDWYIWSNTWPCHKGDVMVSPYITSPFCISLFSWYLANCHMHDVCSIYP